jgi:hypothetical protein
VPAVFKLLRGDFTPSVDLRSTIVRDAGATALAAALDANSTVMDLDLRGPEDDPGFYRLQEAGVAVMAGAVGKHPSLTSLDLGWNEARDEGVSALADALIAGREGEDEAGLPNTRLIWLGLARTGIEQEGLAAVVKLMTTRDVAVQTLQLQQNGLPGGAAPLLARIVAGEPLYQLDAVLLPGRSLYQCSSAWQISHYIQCSSARQIRLGSASLTLKPHCGSVAGAPSLTDLDVSANPLGPAGVAGIALALRTNTTLVSLDVGQTLMRRQGADAIARAFHTGGFSMGPPLQHTGGSGAGAATGGAGGGGGGGGGKCRLEKMVAPRNALAAGGCAVRSCTPCLSLGVRQPCSSLLPVHPSSRCSSRCILKNFPPPPAHPFASLFVSMSA